MEKSKNQKIKRYIQYHKNGTIWAKGFKLNGKMHGSWKWFRKNGVILRSGSFDKGHQVGKWITYDSKGKTYKVTLMK